MYDVVVIGQGLSGLMSAIWAKEQGFSTALAAIGTGKIMQSTGVMDLLPGSDAGIKEWGEHYHLDAQHKLQLTGAVAQFKTLTKKLDYPYKGDIENPITIVTGSGHIKKTALYPETISPLPDRGHVVVVGFEELTDFQPGYVMRNLQKARPEITADAIKIRLGKHTQRTMTQLDAARLIDQKATRDYLLKQIKAQLKERNICQPKLFIFPASLGVENWKEVLEEFTAELKSAVTEAPGMPPNATAIRLHESLKKEAVKSGVRFYVDTTVTGCQMDGNKIESLKIKTANQVTDLCGKQFILATGGILGGGLEVTPDGIKETALQLDTDEFGRLRHCPANLYPIGASQGTKVTHHGITGGIFTILSTYEMTGKLQQQAAIGGTRSA